MPTVIGIVILNFLLLQLAPGDAADVIAGEAGAATEETMAMLRRQFGLDLPVIEQLLAHLGNLAQGSLGFSPRYNMPVAGLIAQRLPGTLREDGKPIAGPHPSRVVVFQDPTLLPWLTVRDNVALGSRALGTLNGQWPRVGETLALAGLGKFDSLTRLTMQAELVSLWQRRDFTANLVTHDVEEALFLAPPVVIFSDGPARVKADFAVDLPYPRHRDDPRLAKLRRESLGLLGETIANDVKPAQLRATSS